MSVALIYHTAFQTFLLCMGITAGLIWQFGAQSFTFIYERWVGFATAAILMSVFQGIALYLSSFSGNKLLALGGNTGNPIYDVRNTYSPKSYMLTDRHPVLHWS